MKQLLCREARRRRLSYRGFQRLARITGRIQSLSPDPDLSPAVVIRSTRFGWDNVWHSSAHILGESVEQKYECKLCIGPCTTRGEGFYYDAFYGDLGLNEVHFKQIEAASKKSVDEKQSFERIEVTRDQALDMFSDNQFKVYKLVEIIKDLPEDKTITVYRCGPLVDLCPGPHIPNTSFVKEFSCLKHHLHIGVKIKIAKACKEFMEYLIQIKNV